MPTEDNPGSTTGTPPAANGASPRVAALNDKILRELSGLELEYRLLQIYCRDAGRKEGMLGFSLWRDAPGKKPARQRVAASSPVSFFFESAPAVLVRLGVRDHDGKPTTGAFTNGSSGTRAISSGSWNIITPPGARTRSSSGM